MAITKRLLFWRATTWLILVLSAQAMAIDVTVAYQTSAEPAKVAQADNTFAKESGANVSWRKFDSGANIVKAMASGDVQIGNLGSSPLAAAVSQHVPIEVFLLASRLGSSEALVVKPSIKKPQDLIGKRIAVPFVSTAHYSLLAALKHWGIKPQQLNIINLQPPAIAAAWQRGDIDGAYVWAPAVNVLHQQGYTLTDSSQVGEWGSPALDVWVVRRDFAQQHPDIVTAFTRSTIASQETYRANPQQWLANADNLTKLSRLSGVPQDSVATLVQGNYYFTAHEQIETLGTPLNDVIRNTALFLQQQGKIPQVAPDYSAYISNTFIKAAQAPQP